jgi:hypothetical protein
MRPYSGALEQHLMLLSPEEAGLSIDMVGAIYRRLVSRTAMITLIETDEIFDCNWMRTLRLS